MGKVNIKIEGVPYQVDEGVTILHAARECGYEIPTLCSRKCPVEAIHGLPGKTPFAIDQSMCVKCGMCISTCKFDAIHIE